MIIWNFVKSLNTVLALSGTKYRGKDKSMCIDTDLLTNMIIFRH